MRASKNAIDLIKKFEGCRLSSYKAVSTEPLYTIGYGHYGVAEGIKITQKEADDYLIQDMQRAVQQVNKYQTLYRFDQNQFDALVSFAYNVGNIKGVTKCGERTKSEIANAILLYTKSGGKELKGLVTRRNAEHLLFTTIIEFIPKTASQVAREVIAGRWGSGLARKTLLELKGYNYEEVQSEVNKLIS